MGFTLKKLRFLFCSILIISIILSFNACSLAEKEQNYVTARYGELISKSENAVCWVTNTNKNFYIEHNNQIKSSLDYHINIAPYFYNPFLSENYMYYIGGIRDNFTHDVYIAQIDYTKEKPKLEQITENYNEIFSYTVCGNTIFFTAGRNGETNLYMKKFSDDKEEILFPNYNIENFCTNGKKLIIANKIYDIKTQKVELLSENKNLIGLGVIDNKYYCFYTGNNQNNVLRIDLNDYTTEDLCKTPCGMGTPRLCDDKILFHEKADYYSIVGLYYYDIPANKIVTVVDSDNSDQRYSDKNEPTVSYEYAYDYIVNDNMYYLHYGRDVITRINMDTKQEEIFQSFPTGKNIWLSHKDYLANRDK